MSSNIITTSALQKLTGAMEEFENNYFDLKEKLLGPTSAVDALAAEAHLRETTTKLMQEVRTALRDAHEDEKFIK